MVSDGSELPAGVTTTPAATVDVNDGGGRPVGATRSIEVQAESWGVFEPIYAFDGFRKSKRQRGDSLMPGNTYRPMAQLSRSGICASGRFELHDLGGDYERQPDPTHWKLEPTGGNEKAGYHRSDGQIEPGGFTDDHRRQPDGREATGGR